MPFEVAEHETQLEISQRGEKERPGSCQSHFMWRLSPQGAFWIRRRGVLAAIYLYPIPPDPWLPIDVQEKRRRRYLKESKNAPYEATVLAVLLLISIRIKKKSNWLDDVIKRRLGVRGERAKGGRVVARGDAIFTPLVFFLRGCLPRSVLMDDRSIFLKPAVNVTLQFHWSPNRWQR